MKVNNKVKARVKIHHSFLLKQLSSVIMNVVHKLYCWQEYLVFIIGRLI